MIVKMFIPLYSCAIMIVHGVRARLMYPLLLRYRVIPLW